ncbi:hypothetical protein [Chondrinema litorale]|uniref:hypothetical protein n=1 Tax=Chondrinema litorale TaxID=2994555 RepID=UPI002543035B|nr:hypothetical protein [Chondrinema litorale]UZR97839.1 hypothetical protein OQ292_28915 [Chondrinema litorale]
MSTKSDHCLVCENHHRDVLLGVLCGLTKQRPSFNRTCQKIKFGQNLYKRIELVNLDKRLVESKKNLTIGNFIFFILLSFCFVLFSIYLFFVTLSSGVIATLPFVIGFVGLLILPYAVGPARKYWTERSIMKEKLTALTEVLNLYGLEYELDMQIEKGYHNILEVTVQIKLKKNGKLAGKYTNSFSYNNNEEKTENYSVGEVIGGIGNFF